MKLDHYIRISSRRERQRLAHTCGTTVGYLYQIAGQHRRPGVPLALRLEGATAGAVCRCHLRPDIFTAADCPHGRHLPTTPNQHQEAS